MRGLWPRGRKGPNPSERTKAHAADWAVRGVALSTWTARDLPVLRVLVAMFEVADAERSKVVRPGELPVLTGLSESDVKEALRATDRADPPYIICVEADLSYPIAVVGVTERALRVVGQWPVSDDAADAIIAALSDAAEHELDKEKQSALRRTAPFIAGAGREVFYRVVTTVASQEI